MNLLDVNKFKSKLTGGGARSNLFRVILNQPFYVAGDTELASFMIKAASLPPSKVGKVEVDFRGRKIPYPGDRTFDDWKVTIINDTNFKIRDSLVRWMNAFNDLSTNTAIVSDPKLWYSDFLVQQLDKSGNIVKTYTIVDAFPSEVGEIVLNYETTDKIEEFDATFSYLYWE